MCPLSIVSLWPTVIQYGTIASQATYPPIEDAMIKIGTPVSYDGGKGIVDRTSITLPPQQP